MNVRHQKFIKYGEKKNTSRICGLKHIFMYHLFLSRLIFENSLFLCWSPKRCENIQNIFIAFLFHAFSPSRVNVRRLFIWVQAWTRQCVTDTNSATQKSFYSRVRLGKGIDFFNKIFSWTLSFITIWESNEALTSD